MKNLVCLFVTIISLFTIVLFSCHSWQRDITVDDISYSKFRYTGREPESEHSYTIGLLKEPVKINGAVYKGYLHLRGNGSVSGGILDEQFVSFDIILPEGTWVSFTEDNQLETCALPANMVIQGHTVLGSGGGVMGAHTSFYDNGRLRIFFSPKNVVIDSVPCRGGVFSYIELHRNGMLKNCTLYKDAEINGTDYQKGDKLEFSKTGELISSKD